MIIPENKYNNLEDYNIKNAMSNLKLYIEKINNRKCCLFRSYMVFISRKINYYESFCRY